MYKSCHKQVERLDNYEFSIFSTLWRELPVAQDMVGL